MESNGIPGGMYSNNVQPGMIGLEMSLHHNRQPPQNPHQHHAMAAAADHPQPRQPTYPYGVKSKNQPQPLTLSDDDEPAGFTPENSADDCVRKNVMSPWQRMKWTDNMVRLLIMVVFYIGDEVGPADGNNNNSDPAAKKKGGGGGSIAVQRKGKWKSVSRAMMERGFSVSPQQCEDKFNDLNKRYKRVNDILGKGTACRVVEDQTLLDTMDHLSPKQKEEAKKLLNSKHLFFREMCAYHNSCGHGTSTSSAQPLPEAAAEPSGCLHSSENAKRSIGEDEDDEDADDEEDEYEENDYEEEEVVRKRARKDPAVMSPAMQQLGAEVMAVVQEVGKSVQEKMQWMRVKVMQLEEQGLGLHSKSLELEKQRLKWLKFSSKKEREMEREKLVQERMKLEKERMVLLVRQKELELMDGHGHGGHHCHSSNRKSDPSSITG